MNCVIYRLGEESFLKGRSYCPHCGHELSWKDLIPVISYLLLRGKCRYCNHRISVRYPVVELSTGLLFGLVFYLTQGFGFSWSQLPLTLFWLIIASLLLVIFVYDLQKYVIPDSVLIVTLVVIGVWYGASLIFNYYGGYEILIRLISGVGAALPLLLIVLLSRGKWMGMGDVKLTFVMGLLVGWPEVVIGLFSAFVIGGIMGIVLIVLGRKEMKSKVAFGPLLILGTFIAWGWAQQILNWYLNFLYYD